MKHILLTVAALATLTMSTNAQTRMALHEEFTGENCPPCASTNPTFWALCDQTTPVDNTAKMIHISYMVPIPSAGWYCNRTMAIYTARDAYYSVPFAPYGRFDGNVPDPTCGSPAGSSAGHPGCLTQADINTEQAIAAPFNITVTNSWNATFDSVITNVTVTCVTAYSGTLFLRTALIQTNDFIVPPGTNGETHFENVVQAMYPDPTGTSIPGTWTVGMTNSYTVKGAVPSWIDKSAAPYMVVWVQNDVDKTIQQAAKATPLPTITVDAAAPASTAPGMVCTGSSYVLAHSVTLKNTGLSTLTSANIYYKVDAGSYATFAWTGSVAAGATTSVTMPTVTVPVAACGYHYIIDSVGMPNGTADINTVNNAVANSFFTESNTPVAMPYATSFEGSDYLLHYISDDPAHMASWSFWYNTTTPLGHTGSYAAKYDNYNAALGYGNVLTMPEVTTSANSTIDFWVADCQVTGTENDKLEVVYSTDCGANWTSIWNLSGSALATVPASNYYFTPNTASQYVKHTAALNTVPAGSIIAFRATSNHGQNLWLDDINIRSTVEVNKVVAATDGINIYPNPAKTEAVLSFNLTDRSDVQVQIVDGLGRIMNTVANEKMEAGAHNYTINTASLANGIYNVVIHTDSGTNTVRLSVAN